MAVSRIAVVGSGIAGISAHGDRPFFSHNRWNWATFDDRDHIGHPRGPVSLLTNLRDLGYCLHRVSYFDFYGPGGELAMVMAAVHNTLGERHPYWLDPSIEARTPSGRHGDFDKAFLARDPWIAGQDVAAIHCSGSGCEAF